MRPSAVSRLAALSCASLFCLRRISTAFSMSPPASVRAALHFIICMPVRARSFMTSAALTSIVTTLLGETRSHSFHLKRRPGRAGQAVLLSRFVIDLVGETLLSRSWYWGRRDTPVSLLVLG